MKPPQATSSRKNVSDRRKAAGLSIYMVAKLAHLKWETVRSVERGDHPPLPSTLAKIDAVLRDHGV